MSALDMALCYHQFPIAHLLLSRETQGSSSSSSSSSSVTHLNLAIMEGDADAVDFLLDVPLHDARALLAPSSSSSSSSSSSNLVTSALACRGTDEIRARIITTLRRAGLATDTFSIPSGGSSTIADDMSVLLSQPLSAFVKAHTRRVFEAAASGSCNVLQP